jgi:hypothetical protein
MLYKPKFRLLHEAVFIVACRLKAAAPEKYAGSDTSIDDARKELLKALLEGDVNAEGVSWDVPASRYELPSVEIDIWDSIGRGVWSHERLEISGPASRLDNIVIHWDDGLLEYLDSDGQLAECGKYKIQLSFDDIDRAFCVPETSMGDQALQQAGGPAMRPARPRRGRRPAPVRDEVNEWLNNQPDRACLCNQHYTVTAHCYCTEVEKLRDDLKINKCVDNIRRLVKRWCGEHQSRRL